jgi:Uma2 family endonuclease
MSSTSRFTPKPPGAEVPPLVPGERLTQPEFHHRYEAYPEDVKFELVGGIVYMASPLRRSHGSYHPVLSGVLWLYMSATPGVQVLDNATTILGEESEPQPDLELHILSQYGGQSRETAEDYVEGPPELMVEVSHSTRILDLRHKRDDYERAGVVEYMVLLVEEQELRWWHSSLQGSQSKPIGEASFARRCFRDSGFMSEPCWPGRQNG